MEHGPNGFFGIANRYAGLVAKNDPLVKINALVEWEDFRGRLEAVWRKPPEERMSNAGCKPWDAVVMFKAIILCSLYNLSDDQVECQVRDRLSFIRFLGLGLEDNVPDAKAVSGLWADSAYWSAEIKAKLEGKGLKSRIHRKGHRNKPLTEREMQAAGAAG